MPRASRRIKGRSDGKPFLMIRREIVDSAQYAALSPYAVKLLIDLHAQYRGNNNGDLCATFTVMRPRGWRSKDTLDAAIKQARERGFIRVARQGGINPNDPKQMHWKGEIRVYPGFATKIRKFIRLLWNRYLMPSSDARRSVGKRMDSRSSTLQGISSSLRLSLLCAPQ